MEPLPQSSNLVIYKGITLTTYWIQIYTALERHIEQPDFLTKLEAARRRRPPSSGSDLANSKGEEVLHKEWWKMPASATSLAEAEGFTEVHL